MAGYWRERPASGTITETPPTYTIEGQVLGEANGAIAYAIALGVMPAHVYVGTAKLFRQDLRCVPNGYGIHDITAPYAEKKTEQGSYTWTADTTGGTYLVKCAKEHIQSYPAPGQTAGTHNGAIGVADGKVEGVQAVIGALKLSVTVNQPEGILTMSYVKQVKKYTGWTNQYEFLEHDPGELLFLGMSASDGSEAPVTATYQFVSSDNATGLSFGTIAGVAKKGHEYAWVEFMENATGGVPGKEPRCVYVERIYDPVDLAAVLGWG